MTEDEYVAVASQEVCSQLKVGESLGTFTISSVQAELPRLVEGAGFKLAVRFQVAEIDNVTFRYDKLILPVGNAKVEPETSAMIYCANLIEDLHFAAKRKDSLSGSVDI